MKFAAKTTLSMAAALSIGLGGFFTVSTAESVVERGKNPLADLRLDDTKPRMGKILARLQTGSYTYLHVKPRDAAPFWSVVLGTGPARGADVRITSYGRKIGFYSPRLNRRFDELTFGTFTLISK